jgi:tetratricopeptide (TPR) repeat protein
MSRRAQEAVNRLLEGNTETPRVSEYIALLAAIQRNLGEVYMFRGLADQAESALKEAQRLYERLATSQDLPEYWQALARSSTQLGEVYKNQPANRDKAEKVQQKALAIFEKLAEQHKDVPEYAYDLGRCYGAMAQTADRAGRFEVALGRHDKSIEIMEEVLGKGFFRARPKLRDFRVNRILTLAKKGVHRNL